MKVFLYPNLSKPHSRQCTDEACTILAAEKAEILMEDQYSGLIGNKHEVCFSSLTECVRRCDVIVVTGGDGTILRCSAEASKFDKPILGVNCGTLGFMTSLECGEIRRLSELFKGEYTISERMMLSVTVRYSDGKVLSADALNDAVLAHGEATKIADFEVSKSGITVSELRADGIIFSTPTGASAYSLSAGGAIIEPDIQCIEFSQVCAHSLFSRPIVFTPDSELSVRCNCSQDGYAVLSVDGAILARVTNGDVVEIKRSELKTRLIDLTGGSFFTSINRKLMKPLKQ